MPEIAVLSDAEAAVRAATDIVTLESIRLDEETLLRELTGLCISHKRIVTGITKLVEQTGQEVPHARLAVIRSYCPPNCTLDYGPADNQPAALITTFGIGERGTHLARIDQKTLVARPNRHRDREFYALYKAGPLVAATLGTYGSKQGRERLIQAVHALSNLRTSFLAEQ